MEIFNDSILLTTPEDKDFVKTSVPNFSSSIIAFNLLYRGSTDGWDVSDFHSKCDNKGPTITLIKSKAGRVCGGFTSIPWVSEDKDSPDASAYLFSVDFKTKYMSNCALNSVGSSEYQGPWFGGC